jgi:hypothetical protein
MGPFGAVQGFLSLVDGLLPAFSLRRPLELELKGEKNESGETARAGRNGD